VAGVFISYRREDTRPWALTLRDHLVRMFGERQVFFDVDSLGVGNWRAQIEDALHRCAVVLVLIGPRWATATDVEGRRRLEREDDVHRFEVASALGRRDTMVIPVLVDSARLPAPNDLPDDLRSLLGQQAITIDDAKDERMAGMRRLTMLVDGRLGQGRERRRAVIALGTIGGAAFINTLISSRSVSVSVAFMVVAAAVMAFSFATYRHMQRAQMKGAWLALVALILSGVMTLGSIVRIGTA
jgi:hypothetical protein